MAITLRAKKVVTFAGTTTAADIALDSGWDASFGDGNANYAPVEGDIVIATYATGSSTDRSIGVTTSGYTEEAELYSNDTSDTNFSVSWKIMTSTPDTTINRSATGNNQDAGAIVLEVWSGVDPATPMDVTRTTATGIDTGRPDPPSITPTTAGAVVIVCGGGAATAGAVYTQSGSELSNFLSGTSADTFDAMVATGSFAWSSGAFNPVAWTGGTTGTGDSWCAVSLALRPVTLSITADPGSYSITGVAADLVAGISLPADVGSYAYTGVAAGLLKGTLTSVDPGSYLITGQDAGTQKGLVLTAERASNVEISGDPSFDDSGYWNVITTGWTVSGGNANASAASSWLAKTGLGSIIQSGRGYAFEYEITARSAGSVRVYVASLSSAGPSETTTGVKSGTLTAVGSGEFGFNAASGFTGTISYLSIKYQDDYFIAGQTTGLLKGKTITADVGSYIYTGVAASLLWGHQLTGGAAVGSYSITGVAATIGRNLQLTGGAAVGNYALTGQTAGLLKNYQLTAGAAVGSYNLTGQTASLLKGFQLTGGAASGSYTYIGVDANMFVDTTGYTITADEGTYAITGVAATFVRTYIAPLTPGSYTITGTAANLLTGRYLTGGAGVGSYTYTGVATTFLRSYVTPANVGSYVISGVDATLLKTMSLIADIGSYVITGTPTNFKWFRLEPAIGSYIITGQAATFEIADLADIIPIPNPLVIFRHQEAEIVRVPKLNELARQVFVRQSDVLSMAELTALAPTMGLQVHVWDAPGGYTPAYADGFNWRQLSDGTVLI